MPVVPSRPRTWLSRLAVLTAAAASLATSQPRWERKHPPITGTLTLDAENPNQELHFTLASSHDQDARLEASLRRVGGDGASKVWIMLRPDTVTTPPTAPTTRPSSRLEESGRSALVDHADSTCRAGPCSFGYRAHLVLDGARPGESVKVDWTLSASVGQKGDDKPPKGAFITARQDPPPAGP